MIDDHGNVGTYAGLGIGPGVGMGSSIGLSGSVSNAFNICGIGGPFTNVSLGGGEGAGATADFYSGRGPGPNGFVMEEA